QGGEKQLVHARAQVGERRGVGVTGGAEDPKKGLGRSGGTDRKAEAGDTVGAELLEGLVRVGLRVAGFVAVVVRKAVGENEQEAVGRAGFGLEDFAGAADTGTEAGVAVWLQSVQPGSGERTEALPEGLYGGEAHGGSPVGAKAVDGDAVAELVQGDGQR